jgi:TolB-like protein
MNRALVVLSVVLAGVTAAFAAPPATQPAPQAISNATILVLPFEPPTGNYSWVGRAIQQDLLVDLTQMTRAHVLAPSGPPASDADSALRAARDAGANYAVFGSAQSAGSQIRATGQVLDVATGRTLGNFKATAPADDLFPLEDAVAVQVVRALPGAVAPATAPSGTVASQPLPRVINEQPYVSEMTPAPQYQSVPGPDYGYGPYVYEPYPYVYPGYYYPGYAGLGFFGAGVIIEGHHFHDHDFDHDHFGHGFDHRNFVSPHVNPGVFSRSGHGGFRGSAGFGGARGGLGGAFGGTRGGFAGGGGHMGGGHAGGGGRGR